MRQTDKEISDNPIIHRILDLLKKRKLTQKDLMEHLGLPNGTFTRWKYSESNGYIKYASQIAKYLGVSEGYLLYGIDKNVNEGTLDEDEIRLVNSYRNLNRKKKKLVLEIVSEFSDSATAQNLLS